MQDQPLAAPERAPLTRAPDSGPEAGALAEIARTLNQFEHRWNQAAQPFDWKFTGQDLAELIARLRQREPQLKLTA